MSDDPLPHRRTIASQSIAQRRLSNDAISVPSEVSDYQEEEDKEGEFAKQQEMQRLKPENENLDGRVEDQKEQEFGEKIPDRPPPQNEENIEIEELNTSAVKLQIPPAILEEYDVIDLEDGYLPKRRQSRAPNNSHTGGISVFIDQLKVRPPNLNELTEFINQNHCRRPYREGDALDQVRRYPICSTYLGKFSHIKKDRKSQIQHQGVGVVLYFMFYKYLAVLFTILFMLSLVSIYFYSNGNGPKSESFGWQDALTSVSLGNLGDNGEVCLITTNLPQTVSCTTGEIVTGSLEVFNATSANGCNQRRHLATQKDKGDINCTPNSNDVKQCELTGTSSHLSALTYPMVVIPCKVKEIQLVGGQIRLEKQTVALIVVIIDVVIVFIFMVALVVATRWEYIVQYEVEQERLTVRDFSIQVTNLPPLPQHQLRVQLWEFISKKILEHEFVGVDIIDIQLAFADNEILFLEMKIKKYTKKEMLFKAKIRLVGQKEGDKLKQKMFKIKEKRKAAEKKLEQASGKKTIVKAFVTFDYQTDKAMALKTFGKSRCRRCCMIGCCMRKKLEPYYFYGKWPKVTHAPQPTVIQWENLSFNKCTRCMRRCFSFFIALLLILVSFAFILVAKYYQNQAQNNDTTCENENDITQAQAAADFALAQPSGLYECYCKRQFFATQNTNPPQDYCQQWLQRWLVAQAWTVGAISIISLVNVILVVILRLLAKFERSHSINSEMKSSTLKIFVATFFNTGLVLLLANANINIPDLRSLSWFPIFAGDYTDFEAEWYQKVGSSIMLTMIVNIFTPHFTGFASLFFVGCSRCCDRGCTFDRRKTKKLIQQDYEVLYLGPYFQIQYRYAQILSTVYITFMYSSGMPVLYFMAAIWFIITFFIDKCLYLRLYKSLPHFDRQVHSYMRELFAYALFLHMGIGFWMYSNTQIFLTDQQTLLNFVNDNFSFFAAERFTSTHSILMVLSLVGFIIFYILRQTLIEKCLNCCSKRRLKLTVVKTKENYLSSLDVYKLQDRELNLKLTNAIVHHESKEMADQTRELTDNLRKKIGKQIQNDVNEISQGEFGRVLNAKGKLDMARFDQFVEKFKESIPQSKINGLHSYLMTENEKYRELVEWRRHNIAERHSEKPSRKRIAMAASG